MSTFIVRFVDPSADTFCGRVRHVTSGEESAFADERGLFAFFERMNALSALARANAELVDSQGVEPGPDEAAACAAPPADAPPSGNEG